MKAKIRLVKGNHEFKEKSLKLSTIYGDVYAPLSAITIINNVAVVPDWVFVNKGLNPCQMIKGFEGMDK